MPEYNMSEEKRPPQLLTEGARIVRIAEMVPATSKNGNEQYVTTIEDVKTRKSMPVYLIAVPKKRWMLKSLLTACGIPAGQDGVYKFDLTDIIGKTVVAIIEHVQEPWTNREGNQIMQTKAKVTEFVQPEYDASGEAIAWEN